MRGLKTRVGRECRISRWRARLNSEGMPQEFEEEVTVLREGTELRGQLQELGLPRVLNLERESCEHLRWTHLKQVQHFSDLLHQVTFLVHTEQEKMGPGLR